MLNSPAEIELSLLGWEAGASTEASVGLSFDSSKMVKNIVKNTLLTDFLNVIDDANMAKTTSKLPQGTIKKFKGYTLIL